MHKKSRARRSVEDAYDALADVISQGKPMMQLINACYINLCTRKSVQFIMQYKLIKYDIKLNSTRK